jgi:hypothetical protein
MCELLIKASNSRGEKRVKDPKRLQGGHVVSIMPGGHNWTAAERGPKYIILKVRGVPIEHLSYLKEAVFSEKMNMTTGEIYRLVDKARKRKINLDSIEAVSASLASKSVPASEKVALLESITIEA